MLIKNFEKLLSALIQNLEKNNMIFIKFVAIKVICFFANLSYNMVQNFEQYFLISRSKAQTDIILPTRLHKALTKFLIKCNCVKFLTLCKNVELKQYSKFVIDSIL